MRKPARRLALGLGAINLATLVAVTAISAKDGVWGVGAGELPPGARPISEIARILEHQGLERIYSVEVDERQYVVKALDAAGRRVRLTLDPMTGMILP